MTLWFISSQQFQFNIMEVFWAHLHIAHINSLLIRDLLSKRRPINDLSLNGERGVYFRLLICLTTWKKTMWVEDCIMCGEGGFHSNLNLSRGVGREEGMGNGEREERERDKECCVCCRLDSAGKNALGMPFESEQSQDRKERSQGNWGRRRKKKKKGWHEENLNCVLTFSSASLWSARIVD